METSSPFGGKIGRLETRDVSISPETPDLIGREAFSRGRFASLTIQDSSDNFIRIESGQTAK
jgi:hypothetical protein